jgi:hypothetical protein
MKLTPIAAAALVPSTLAGIAFSIMPFVTGPSAAALTARPAAHTVSHVRAPAQPSARRVAGAAAAKSAKAAPATRQPVDSQPAADGQAAADGSQPETGTAANTTGQSLTAGMSSFEQCVAWRESTDTPTDPDGLFGILPSVWAQLGYAGTAGQATVAQQEAAFNQLYAQYGAQPWAPSDGC